MYNTVKIWGTINDGEIEIQSLTEADLEEALNVLDKSFFLYESVCNACEINLPKNTQARSELRELCRLAAQDGVSLVAKNVANGELVAVAFNKIQYIPNEGIEPFFLEFRNKQTASPQAQRLMDFMIEVDGETDVFEIFQIDCLCEMMFLATLPQWERRGIGRSLAHYTIEMTRNLCQGIGMENIHPSLRMRRPRAVTALFTSLCSQKVGRSQGFRVLNSVPYTQFNYNGKPFDKNISPLNKTCEHVAIVF